MAKQTLQAIYENGVFRPLASPKVKEGAHVLLTVEPSEAASREDLIDLAGRVYEGLTDEEVILVEKIALDRGNFFRE